MQGVDFEFVATLFSVIVGLLQLKQQNSQEIHPKTMSVAVYSLLICWFLYSLMLRLSRVYGAYSVVVVVRLGVNFFGSLSVASAFSFLFPVSVRPLVYFFGLLMPMGSIFYLILQKLEDRYCRTEFWNRNIDPVISKVTRMFGNGGQLRPPMLPLYICPHGWVLNTLVTLRRFTFFFFWNFRHGVYCKVYLFRKQHHFQYHCIFVTFVCFQK